MPAAPPKELTLLPNGLRVVCERLGSARTAAVSLHVGAGAAYERDEVAGVSHLLEHWLFKGSDTFPTAAALSTAVEGGGGYINAATGPEATIIHAQLPADEWRTALAAVLDLASRPRLERAELEKERQVVLEELAQIEDDPFELIGVLLAELAWAGSPLGRDTAGSPQSVLAIGYEAAVAYWRRQYVPQNAVLSVAGQIEPQAIAAEAAKLTAGWSGADPLPRLPTPLSQAPQRVHLKEKDTEQTQLLLALPFLPRKHPDYAAGVLLSTLLGGGMSSRLFLKVREELGLVYNIQSRTEAVADSGLLEVELGVDPEQAEAALAASLGEIGKLREGVGEEELARTRRYLLGGLLMGLERTLAVAEHNGGGVLFGVETGWEALAAEYEAVTAKDVQRLAEEWLVAEEVRLAAVGPHGNAGPFAAGLRF